MGDLDRLLFLKDVSSKLDLDGRIAGEGVDVVLEVSEDDRDLDPAQLGELHCLLEDSTSPVVEQRLNESEEGGRGDMRKKTQIK